MSEEIAPAGYIVPRDWLEYSGGLWWCYTEDDGGVYGSGWSTLEAAADCMRRRQERREGLAT